MNETSNRTSIENYKADDGLKKTSYLKNNAMIYTSQNSSYKVF